MIDKRDELQKALAKAHTEGASKSMNLFIREFNELTGANIEPVGNWIPGRTAEVARKEILAFIRDHLIGGSAGDGD